MVSDIHGDVNLLRGILVQVGALNQLTDSKNPGWRVYQVGDLVNRARLPYYLKVPQYAKKHHLDRLLLAEQARDFHCLEKGEQWLDGVCIGNHEWVDFGGMPFTGCDDSPSLVRDRVRRLHASGFYKASYCVGDWLITHAGVHPRYLHEHALHDMSPVDISEHLNRLVDEFVAGPSLPYFKHPWFALLGRERTAGLLSRHAPDGGGIFWCGWEQLGAGYRDYYDGLEDISDVLRQIVGHTPQRGAPRRSGRYPVINLDVGARASFSVSAAISADDGKTWRTEVYKGRNELLEVQKHG